jgi:hypothetical protein
MVATEIAAVGYMDNGVLEISFKKELGVMLEKVH